MYLEKFLSYGLTNNFMIIKFQYVEGLLQGGWVLKVGRIILRTYSSSRGFK